MTEYQMVKISIYLVTSMQYRNETVARIRTDVNPIGYIVISVKLVCQASYNDKPLIRIIECYAKFQDRFRLLGHAVYL